MDIVVTDLTRFSNPDIVCTAGIDIVSGAQIRPMPYLKSQRCKELNLQPGAILKGEFTPVPNRARPHIEDMSYSSLTFVEPCNAEMFHEILTRSLSAGLSAGFGVKLSQDEKCIPLKPVASASLITIRIAPRNFSIVRDKFKKGSIKANITDNEGLRMSFVGITDRGFAAYAEANSSDSQLTDRLNSFIQNQRELFLRIGISREFAAPDGRIGFWIQLNGIYTFPNYLDAARSY